MFGFILTLKSTSNRRVFFSSPNKYPGREAHQATFPKRLLVRARGRLVGGASVTREASEEGLGRFPGRLRSERGEAGQAPEARRAA